MLVLRVCGVSHAQQQERGDTTTVTIHVFSSSNVVTNAATCRVRSSLQAKRQSAVRVERCAPRAPWRGSGFGTRRNRRDGNDDRSGDRQLGTGLRWREAGDVPALRRIGVPACLRGRRYRRTGLVVDVMARVRRPRSRRRRVLETRRPAPLQRQRIRRDEHSRKQRGEASNQAHTLNVIASRSMISAQCDQRHSRR